MAIWPTKKLRFELKVAPNKEINLAQLQEIGPAQFGGNRGGSL